MYELSWNLRSKPDWQRKAADLTIRDKWRSEALQQTTLAAEAQRKRNEMKRLPRSNKAENDSEEPDSDSDSEDIGHKTLSEKMIDYVLDELDGHQKIADNERGIERGCFDAIWYSDRLISDDLAQRLKSAVSALEDVPDDKKDWHPGSNGQVLDLVHPSLYCVVYGRTHAYLPGKPRTGANLLPVQAPPAKRFREKWTSTDFCWMPSDFAVNEEDGSVKLTSPYINNIHPVLHQPLYRVIEEILAGFIPMFERVLGDSNRENEPDHTPFSSDGRLGDVSCIWGPDGNWNIGPDEEPPSDEDEDEFIEKYYREHTKILPEAEDYTGQLEDSFFPVSLRGRTIQCIIKLANIHLTPERPEYAGGSWHVEGMMNENIVASGIYYYDEENVTESKLAFRIPVSPPGYHGQDDNYCTKMLYGMDRDCECLQEIGAMVTEAGRTLSWPNLFQHCVSPFKLSDPSKSGHRKILAIFLVNPTVDPIVSATDVPPQQAEWAAEAFEEACAASTSAITHLPQELRDLVEENFAETVMTLTEAEAYRLDLMKERTAFVEDHTEKAYGQTFNMCEH